LDTCPVGVATQDPVLRSRFSGKPEFVVNFFEYIAEEVREILADLGFRTLEEAVGHSEALNFDSAISHWKAEGLDLSPILYRPESFTGDMHHTQSQDHGLAQALDNELIKIAQPALTKGEPVRAQLKVRNVNRTVGTMLGSELTRIYGGAGLPESTIDVTFEGSAGQSFGAFLPAGITLRLEGDSNDYVGKGLSGGRLIVRPARSANFAAEDNVIAGNVLGYGATSGKIFARGLVGERCCVRNSGATVVVEGVGDHGCEYMTGGRVLILGPTGRNFAAGMSGGIAYVLDLVNSRVNGEMVDVEPLTHDDEEFVKALISEHVDETGSAIGQSLLADWEAAMPRLSKVMPRDYKRVIDAQAKAEAEGRDILEAIMEAARG
jgi:glutamate synthase (NADPH/NADH) large chain